MLEIDIFTPLSHIFFDSYDGQIEKKKSCDLPILQEKKWCLFIFLINLQIFYIAK